MNYITKKTLRQGYIMNFLFILSFLLIIGSVLLFTAFEDKLLWILPIIGLLFTVIFTYDLYKKVQWQKDYKIEIMTFVSILKPLKGKHYSEIKNVIGIESDTMFETIKDEKCAIRIWYALGYSFNAVFDSEDVITEYNEVNEFKNK